MNFIQALHWKPNGTEPRRSQINGHITFVKCQELTPIPRGYSQPGAYAPGYFRAGLARPPTSTGPLRLLGPPGLRRMGGTEGVANGG